MAYFDKVPEILYLKYNKNKYDGSFIAIKNIFSRIKVIDDSLPAITILEDYILDDNERPDTVSFDFYDDPGFDWVIMMINNIKNLYQDWPMEKFALEQYVNSKYSEPNGIHHWITLPQYNSEGRIILPGGNQVQESFRFITPEGDTLSKSLSIGAVSNYEYEVLENDKKREILVLKPELLADFVLIVEKELQFTPSTQFISSSLRLSTE